MDTVQTPLAAALADRYRLERELGRGGMATVFLAEDLKHGRRVAIKVLDPEVAAVIGHERFRREIEFAARLNHPHILPLHDSGAAGGELYYVTPYIEGESLRDRLDREGPLPIADAVRLAREIANGLGHAHHRGLVHRDIKPENVLLSDGIALVADFGIARLAGPGDAPPDRGAAADDRTVDGLLPQPGSEGAEHATLAGTILGTPRYMAPEQIVGGAEVDGRSDLYALGCVLFEMLAGRAPFIATAREALAFQHLCDIPPPVSDFRPEVPPAVVAVIARALAKGPQDRFATTARFADALGVAMAESLVPSRAERAATPNNLPKERTSFVGREAELAEYARALEETRLLSIVGVGGCGKTRLALKLAENRLERHPDGTWFVDLAPVTTPDRVTQTVAAVLGVREELGRPLEATIADHLGARQVLLLLDNCEHLLTACTEFVDRLLATCPELVVVVTSREGLGVDGERVFALRSLSVPRPAAPTGPRELEESDAVRLFVERARSVEPGFALDAQTGPGILEICRRLDGIPLAIELAAARIKVLSLAQICSKLDDRFRLLTGGSRALPRHQTLRATLQWSYDHLPPELQHAFEQLAVFAGGSTLEAAAAVIGEDADEFEVLDWMTALVDKSLVVVGREGPAPRYRMLETMRQFAQERLSESKGGDAARARHLDFFVSFVEAAEPHLYALEQDEWFRRIDQELENILAAHAWCDRDAAGPAKGLRLAGDLRQYWIARGLFRLGLETTREALARPPAGATPERARALYAGGLLATRMAGAETARELLEESVSICRALGDRSGASRGMSLLGLARFNRGERQEAHRYLEEAVATAEGIDRVTALNSLASLETLEGRAESAVPLFEQALALARSLGSSSHTAATLGNLAVVRLLQTDFAAARASLLEAYELSERLDLVSTRQAVIEIAAGVAAAEGDPGRAARLWGSAEVLLEQIGAQRGLLKHHVVLPLIERCRALLGDKAFVTAYAEGRRAGDGAVAARDWLESRAARPPAPSESGPTPL